MLFPVSNMWRCDYNCILAYVFRAGLLSNVKFGPDRNEEGVPLQCGGLLLLILNKVR